MSTKTTHSGFYCQECGHGFKTIKAAEKASHGDAGCPKCGGADIDLGKPASAVPAVKPGESVTLTKSFSACKTCGGRVGHNEGCTGS